MGNWRVAMLYGVVLGSTSTAVEGAPYARAGWTTTLSTLAHGVSGQVTIVDQDTIRLDPFFYDGGGISVYVYLGATDNNPAFAAGLEIGPQLLGTPYNGGSLVIDLPPGQTLEGYTAVSIWCVVAGTNFGSGTFAPPMYPRSGYSASLLPGSYGTSGIATIVNERTIRLDQFRYNGNAPRVYVDLGVTSSYLDFFNGTWIGSQLTRGYNNETLTVQFPPGQAVSGFGAICIWCDVIKMCFTTATFPRTVADVDIDGDADTDDFALMIGCAGGPGVPRANTRVCKDSDIDLDGDVDLRDYALGERCFSGDGTRPDPACIE